MNKLAKIASVDCEDRENRRRISDILEMHGYTIVLDAEYSHTIYVCEEHSEE